MQQIFIWLLSTIYEYILKTLQILLLFISFLLIFDFMADVSTDGDRTTQVE